MHRRCGGGGARGSGGIRRVARGERDASLPERSRTAPNCSVEVGQCKGLLHGGRCSFSPVHVAHFVHSKAAAARKTLSLASLLPTALTGTPVRRDVPPSRAFHFSQIITYKFPYRGMFSVSKVCCFDKWLWFSDDARTRLSSPAWSKSHYVCSTYYTTLTYPSSSPYLCQFVAQVVQPWPDSGVYK